GDEGDVHALGTLDLVELDLREHALLRQTHGVVATAVETARETAEVADTGYGDGNQAVGELPHVGSPQGHGATDRIALPKLEVRQGDPGLGDDGLLTGDGRQVLQTVLE